MIKISKRIVEALEVQNRDIDYFDDDLKGFGIRVRPSGRRTYFVMMRHRCVMRRFTIGSHGVVTAEAARLKSKPWRRICIHDLRHTFASSGVALGQGLPIIGKLLGRTQPQTTARYAHLAASPALEVADKISENLADFMQWKGASKVCANYVQ